MSSEVEICNRALIAVGSKTIISLDDNSTRARTCKLVYGPERDDLLRSYPWKFAIKRIELGLTTEDTLGFAYTYQLPSDMLRLIYPDVNIQFYRIEQDKLLTNYPLSYIRYIYREQNVAKFDSMFQSCLAWRIAGKIAKKLTDNEQLIESLKSDFSIAITQARAASAMEDGPYWVDAEEWLSSRYMGIAGPTGWIRDNRRF